MNAVTPAEALAQLKALLAVIRGEVELRLEKPGSEHRWRISCPGEAKTPAVGQAGRQGSKEGRQPLPLEPGQ